MDFSVGARLMKTWVETDEGVALINDASYPFSYERFCGVCVCVCRFSQGKIRIIDEEITKLASSRWNTRWMESFVWTVNILSIVALRRRKIVSRRVMNYGIRVRYLPCCRYLYCYLLYFLNFKSFKRFLFFFHLNKTITFRVVSL